MSEREKIIIKNLCDCNMNVAQTARVMKVHRNTLAYHISNIGKSTGLDPLVFYDLVKLMNMLSSEETDAECEKEE